MLNRKEIIDQSYKALHEMDMKWMKKNREKLQQTLSIEIFDKAEAKRSKRFKEELVAILEADKLLKDIGIK